MGDAKTPFQPKCSRFFLISFQGPCSLHTKMPLSHPWVMARDRRQSSRRPPSLLKFLIDRVHHWYEEKASFLVGRRWVCFVLGEYCGVVGSHSEAGGGEKGKLNEAGSGSITSPSVLSAIGLGHRSLPLKLPSVSTTHSSSTFLESWGTLNSEPVR